MIYKANKDAYRLSVICDEILTVLNYRRSEEPIELVLQCIKANKEQAEIDKCYFNWHSSSFLAKFEFKNCSERFVVSFDHTLSENGYYFYKSKVISPRIVITQPLYTSLEGLVYCDPKQHITTYQPVVSKGENWVS